VLLRLRESLVFGKSANPPDWQRGMHRSAIASERRATIASGVLLRLRESLVFGKSANPPDWQRGMHRSAIASERRATIAFGVLLRLRDSFVFGKSANPPDWQRETHKPAIASERQATIAFGPLDFQLIPQAERSATEKHAGGEPDIVVTRLRRVIGLSHKFGNHFMVRSPSTSSWFISTVW
jgi:hypothetical protein